MTKNDLGSMGQVYLIFNNVPFLWDTSGIVREIKQWLAIVLALFLFLAYFSCSCQVVDGQVN